MHQLIQTLFENPAGGFGTMFAFALAVLWVVAFVSRKIGEHSTSVKNSEKRTEALEKNLQDRSQKLEDNLQKIREDLAYLVGTVRVYGEERNKKENDFAKAHSPISLTEKGKKVAGELNAEQIIAREFDAIVEKIDKSGAKNPYDIQQYCIDMASYFPEKFFSPASLDAIKLYAYRQGRSLSDYGVIFGIMIRDAYFKRKGIDVGLVDKHDPKNRISS